MPLVLIPPGRRKGYRHWYVRGTFGGREIELSTGATTEEAALRFLGGLPDVLQGPGGGDPATATFGRAVDLYAASRRPSRAQERYLERLRAHLGHRRLADLTGAALVEAAIELYPNASNETRNRQALAVAAAVLHHAADNRLCHWMRVRKLPERPTRPRLPSANAERLLLANATGPLRLALLVLFRHGFRIGDVLRLDAGALDLETGTFRFVTGKTRQAHTVPMHPDVWAALEADPPVGPLFPWRARWRFYKELHPLVRRLGVTFTPHMARHLFATSKRAQGWDLVDIMEAGGWRDLKSVQRYGRANPDRIRALIAGKDPGAAS